MSSTVSRVLYQMIIYLDCTLPHSSFVPCGTKRDIPESTTGRRIAFCFVLLRVGFTQPLTLPQERWSLTPPFHPYQAKNPNEHSPNGLCTLFLSNLLKNVHWDFLLGGFFSVALSLESPPPDVIRHPALWSPDLPHLRENSRLTARPSVLLMFHTRIMVS